MHRRNLLAAGLALPVAGCTDALSRDSAWRELVMNAPDGVYVPPKRDGMTTYAVEPVVGEEGNDSDLAVAVMGTRPHSFLTVAGGDASWVSPRSEDSVHLMATLWHGGSDRVLPVPVSVAIGGGPDRALWPMLSQRMGFHRGDNLEIPGDGRYDLHLEIGEPSARLFDDLSEPLAGGATVEIPIEFDASEIESLERTLIDPDRRGEAGALEPMDHAAGDDHDGAHGNADHAHGEIVGPPVSRVPRVDDLPGTVLETARLDDAVLVATILEPSSDPYLAVSLRTPYNRYPLPAASIAAGAADGDPLDPLEPAIGPDLGHHYGRAIAEPPEEVGVALEAPPQIARHFGYETAFLEGREVVLEP